VIYTFVFMRYIIQIQNHKPNFRLPKWYTHQTGGVTAQSCLKRKLHFLPALWFHCYLCCYRV